MFVRDMIYLRRKRIGWIVLLQVTDKMSVGSSDPLRLPQPFRDHINISDQAVINQVGRDTAATDRSHTAVSL
jgi:hypothetical protein